MQDIALQNPSNKQTNKYSLSVPFVDGLDIAKDHSILAVAEVFGHGYFMILLLLRLAHVLDVLATVLEVTDINPFGVKQFLQSI